MDRAATLRQWVRVAVVTAALAFVVPLIYASPVFDFRAFYCAGRVIAHGSDPYRSEPLRSCEHDSTDDAFTNLTAQTALPAPLPGYALAAFVPLSQISFWPASRIWLCLLFMATVAASYFAARLSGVSISIVFLAFFGSLIAPSISQGETLPISIAAACGAAFAAKMTRWNCAAAFASITLITPTIGLPLCVSLMIWAPRARLMIGLCVAILAVLSISAVGVNGDIEYVREILPAHAYSELTSDQQLSLSVILASLGIPAAWAIEIGTLSYALLGAIGIVIARQLASRFGDDAALVLVPPTFALIGGSFVHVTYLPVAIPLALMLFSSAPIRSKVWLCALLLLCVPWLGATNVTFGFPSALAVFFVLFGLAGMRLAPAALLAGAMLLILVLVGSQQYYANGSHHLIIATVHQPIKISEEYPEAHWAVLNRMYLSSGSALSWLLRIPSWAGLMLLSYGAISILYRSTGATARENASARQALLP